MLDLSGEYYQLDKRNRRVLNPRRFLTTPRRFRLISEASVALVLCLGLKANGPDRAHGPSGPPRISRSLLLVDVVSSLSDTMRPALYHRRVSITS